MRRMKLIQGAANMGSIAERGEGGTGSNDMETWSLG